MTDRKQEVLHAISQHIEDGVGEPTRDAMAKLVELDMDELPVDEISDVLTDYVTAVVGLTLDALDANGVQLVVDGSSPREGEALFTLTVRANVYDPTVTATDIAQWLHDEAVAFPSAQYEEGDLRFDIRDVSAS